MSPADGALSRGPPAGTRLNAEKTAQRRPEGVTVKQTMAPSGCGRWLAAGCGQSRLLLAFQGPVEQ